MNNRCGGIIHVTIYLDVVMVICFIFNGAILYVVTYIVKQPFSWMKLFLGTFLATLYVPIIVFFPQSIFNTVIGKILYSVIIIVSTIGKKPIYYLFKSLVTFYVVSFVAGGAILSVHYLFEHSTRSRLRHLLLYVDNLYHNEISLLILFLGFPLSLYITKVWSDKLIMQEFATEQLYNVTLAWNNNEFSTIGFLDSGNQLIDPLTSRPVIICDALFLQKFFSVEDWFMIKNAIKHNQPENIPNHLASQFSIIPFQTVANSHYLYAIKPDKLIIQTTTHHYNVKHVLVGIQLSPMTNDQTYHCLLHPQIMALERYDVAH